MKGVISDTGVQGSNFKEVQCRLDLVNCGRNSEFAGAPYAEGVHRPRLAVEGAGPYFSAKHGRSKEATLEKFEDA